MASHDSSQRFHERTINRDAREMLRRAEDEHIETVWDRLSAQEPQCGFCSLGLSCRICAMGPCRIDPFGDGPQRGVCGADADTMVARNLARMIASASVSAGALAAVPLGPPGRCNSRRSNSPASLTAAVTNSNAWA